MATSTTKTNKPFNPRAQDQSPKGFNRAKLYSGKALDFDGVNDSVTIPNNASLNFGTSDFSIAFVMKSSVAGYDRLLDKRSGTSGYTINIGPSKEIVLELNDGTGSSQFSTSTIYADGELKHVVIAFNRSGNADFYINGAFDESVDISSKSGNLDSTSDLFIGADAPSGTSIFYDGELSGLKMYSTALTAAQVADLYNNPEKVVPTGVDNTALKLWLPMMEGAGTTAYNGAPGALGSNVVTNGTFDTDLTGWSTNDFSNGSIVQSSGTALITSNGGSGYPSIWQQVSTIVGERYIVKANFSNNTTGVWFWKFDDNTPLGSTNRVQFIDNDATTSIDGVFEFTATSTLSSISAFAEQGNAGSFNLDNVEVLQISNVGTISGATWTHGIGSPVGQTSVIDWNKHTLDGTNEVLIPQGLTAGRDLLGNLFENVRKQGALNLDGNSWAEVHDNGSLDFDSGSWSMECWIDWTPTDGKGVMSRWYSSERSTLLYTSGSVYIRLFSGTSGGTSDYDIISTAITNGWHHIVGTYTSSDSKLRIYIDGSLNVTSSSFANAYNSNANPLEIGRFNASTSSAYTNAIAQPRIYNRALTAEEVQRNYNAGKNTYTN